MERGFDLSLSDVVDRAVEFVGEDVGVQLVLKVGDRGAEAGEMRLDPLAQVEHLIDGGVRECRHGGHEPRRELHAIRMCEVRALQPAALAEATEGEPCRPSEERVLAPRGVGEDRDGLRDRVIEASGHVVELGRVDVMGLAPVDVNEPAPAQREQFVDSTKRDGRLELLVAAEVVLDRNPCGRLHERGLVGRLLIGALLTDRRCDELWKREYRIRVVAAQEAQDGVEVACREVRGWQRDLNPSLDRLSDALSEVLVDPADGLDRSRSQTGLERHPGHEQRELVARQGDPVAVEQRRLSTHDLRAQVAGILIDRTQDDHVESHLATLTRLARRSASGTERRVERSNLPEEENSSLSVLPLAAFEPSRASVAERAVGPAPAAAQLAPRPPRGARAIHGASAGIVIVLLMRGSSTGSKGTVGQHAAALAFAELEWPSTPTSNDEDVGTDLFVSARSRRFDNGSLFGVQVKSGRSWFARPAPATDDAPDGWWFSDDQEHLDYWQAHPLPHVVVLHDPESGLCHWQVVTSETVHRTPRGGRIRVPRNQTVRLADRDRLFAAATANRPTVPYEGSAWTGGVPPAVADHLRFALIVPRLIAPHPNAGAAPGTAAEAIGLIMQARVDDVWRWGQPHSTVPDRTSCMDHRDWGWRFAVSLDSWLRLGDRSALEQRIQDAGAPFQRVAATVVIAQQHLEDNNPRAALALIDAELERDEARPVDHAWLHLQRARSLLEDANLDEAREAAEVAVRIAVIARGDVTASAISGTGAAMLFNTSPLGNRDVGAVIESNDTAVGWWRAQTALRGTVALTRAVFDRSLGRTSPSEDDRKATNELYAAATQAGLLGSQGQWRHYTGLLARQEMIGIDRRSDTADVIRALMLLRAAGDERALASAVRHTVGDGPAEAVTRIGEQIRLDRSTATSVFADLAFLQAAEDVLPEDAAVAAAEWLLRALVDPERFLALTRTTHYSDPAAELVERLAGFVGSMPDGGGSSVVEALSHLSIDSGLLIERAAGTLVVSVPDEAWTPALLGRLPDVSETPGNDFARSVLGVRSRSDPEARRILVQAALGGDLVCGAYLHDIAALAEPDRRALRELYADRVRGDRLLAQTGRLGSGGVDPAYMLASCLLAAPDDQAARILAEVLSDASVSRSYKRSAVRRLAFAVDDLDQELRLRFADAIDGIEAHRSEGDFPMRDHDITGEVRYAVRALRGDALQARLEAGALASGGPRHRMWGAALAGLANDLGGLAVFANDPAPAVRATAAGELARLASASPEDEFLVRTLTQASRDRGRAVAVAIASNLSGHSGQEIRFAPIRANLCGHPCATVRRLARRLESWGDRPL